MKTAVQAASMGLLALVSLMQLAGCPLGVSPAEYVAGGTGDSGLIRDQALVEVLSPLSDLSVAGGTQIEVNWRVAATSRFSVVNVIIDQDRTPNNGNETTAFGGLALEENNVLVDTTRLLQGTYNIGVVLEEIDEIVTFGYAPGTITIDQRPILYFTSPRENYVLDRSQRITPSFQVTWELADPDSVNSVEILLDANDQPNGDEILLYRSDAQAGDSFTFDMPTYAFEPGTYRFLAVVSDQTTSATFYSPTSIQLRSRLSGFYDLRNLHTSETALPGAVFEGFNPRDNVGSFVSTIQDIDEDGYDDFIIVGQFGKPEYATNLQRTGVGEAYLVYGRQKRFSGVINLNATGTLFRGDFITGVRERPDPIRPSRGITSFALLTDWDRDNVRDLAFGVPFTDSQGVYLLDPAGYFRSGAVVLMAGLNLRPDIGFPGRGVIDLGNVGVEPWDGSTDAQCAEGFIGPKIEAVSTRGIDGSTSFYRHLLDVAPTPGGVLLGCRFSTHEFGDQFGEYVSTWEFHSMVVGSPNRDPAISAIEANSVPGGGVVTVYYSSLYAPQLLWEMGLAPEANDQFGYAGPLVGSGANPELLPHGGPYLYVLDDERVFDTAWGRIQASPGYFVDPDDSTDPCERRWAPWIEPGDCVSFYSNVSNAHLTDAEGIGDFNADGLRDLVIGAPYTEDGGVCYIVYGRLRGLVRGANLSLEELALAMNSPDGSQDRVFDGLRIVGNPGEALGRAQDDAGDFNGDGLADVVIGSSLLNNRRGGVLVLYGSRDAANLTPAEIPFNEVPERNLGIILVGEADGDLAGARVAGVGDVDRDGNDDILIAAPNRSVRLDTDFDGVDDIDRTHCGVVYLVYGSPDLRGTLNLADIGTETLPGVVFIGRATDDFLGAGLSEQGDRSRGVASAGDVDGDGAADLLLGCVNASPRERTRAGETYLIYGIGD